MTNVMRTLLVRALLVQAIVWAALPATLAAQTIDDEIMLPRHTLFVGDLYTHESWDEYWEGALKRENGNIGTLTTRTNTLLANYGLTNRWNVIAMVPHVWTRASQGVLQGQEGFQDITLAAKYRLFDGHTGGFGALRVLAIASGGLPLTDYTPDFQPLSIGSASKRVSGRVTVNYQTAPGWFANVSTAYTWRAKVTLDRPFYYTDGRLYFTDEVDMPNVLDYTVSAGYSNRRLRSAFSYGQQRTRGGGDIRRQDMPFVSNRMNFSKVGAGVMVYPVPQVSGLGFQFAYAYTLDGRNVGQATTLTTGILYTFNRHRSPTR